MKSNAQTGRGSPEPPPFAEEATDARLIEQVRRGDDEAFATLVMRYERKLIRVLTRLIHDVELARDLAQETFWKVYTRLDRFDTARRFAPWLFRVGVNLGVDWLRRHPNPGPVSLDQDNERDGVGGGEPGRWREPPDPDPREREELAQEVRFLLDQIPLPYRTILVLRDLEGFSSSEVAAIVGRREATVRWRLAKAREMFRTRWERREGGSGARSRGSSPSVSSAARESEEDLDSDADAGAGCPVDAEAGGDVEMIGNRNRTRLEGEDQGPRPHENEHECEPERQEQERSRHAKR